jgi:hypothetical protein
VPFVIIVLHRAECFGDDTLSRVLHEVGVVGHTVRNHVPVHAFFAEVDGFVVHRAGFKCGVVQQALVISLDVKLEVQCLDEGL